MAVPTTYTEESLSQYMIHTLGEIAGVLNITSTVDWPEDVNEALVMYGASDVSEVEDIPKIRACARFAAWRKALASLTARYNFMSDQQKFERSEMAKMARLQLNMAEADAAAYGVIAGQVVGVGYFIPEVDPYGPVTDEELELDFNS